MLETSFLKMSGSRLYIHTENLLFQPKGNLFKISWL